MKPTRLSVVFEKSVVVAHTINYALYPYSYDGYFSHWGNHSYGVGSGHLARTNTLASESKGESSLICHHDAYLTLLNHYAAM